MSLTITSTFVPGGDHSTASASLSEDQSGTCKHKVIILDTISRCMCTHLRNNVHLNYTVLQGKTYKDGQQFGTNSSGLLVTETNQCIQCTCKVKCLSATLDVANETCI